MGRHEAGARDRPGPARRSHRLQKPRGTGRQALQQRIVLPGLFPEKVFDDRADVSGGGRLALVHPVQDRLHVPCDAVEQPVRPVERFAGQVGDGGHLAARELEVDVGIDPLKRQRLGRMEERAFRRREHFRHHVMPRAREDEPGVWQKLHVRAQQRLGSRLGVAADLLEFVDGHHEIKRLS